MSRKRHKKGSGGKTKKQRPFRWRHFWKVSVIYFILFTAIFGMVDYYALMAFNFLWFLLLAALLGVGLGYLHTKVGKHDHVDEVAEELL
ncbi:hypothetical protein [Hydrogenimonas sp. SS33]|uniref:hypothetical protein n=1 Tax=Hydrogenimonas leucolamina TaxID=2954236 RepID=UPI00336C24B3